MWENIYQNELIRKSHWPLTQTEKLLLCFCSLLFIVSQEVCAFNIAAATKTPLNPLA